MKQAVRQNVLSELSEAGAVPLFESKPSSSSRFCVAFVFIWFTAGGLAHFAFTDVEMRIVPPYIPWPRAAVLLSGVIELLGAVGLLVRRLRPWAATGLFILTVAVTPCHIYMLQRPDLFPAVPIWALWLRLPIQVALLVAIAWCARRSRPRDANLSYYRAV